MSVDKEQIKQFMALFEGSVRSFGRWMPDSGKMFTIKEPPTVADFEAHLRGKTGIGIVPISRDKFCRWGAIDIDIDNIDHAKLDEQIRSEGLPLTVCRSKSGGAHLYLFLQEPVLAPAVRAALTGYAKRLGHGGAEVFPKQNETTDNILGNWINLPYFNADDTHRPAYEGGKPANLEFFLEVVQSRLVGRADLFNPEQGHPDAPPCIQAMIRNGVGPGMRNEALYSIAIYLKRAFPDNWRERTFDINSAFIEPLPHGEARTVINSVARRDYLYKCKQEPCKSLCDSNVCVTRKFGITPTEQKTIVNVEVPVFANLKKYTTEPVYWELEVNGIPCRLTTPELMEYKRLQERVADAQTRLIPGMKNGDWHVLLEGLMNEATIIEAPDEASAPGQVRLRLIEFIERAEVADSKGDRQNLLRGMPVVEKEDGKKIAYFTGPSFQDYLKRVRAEDLKGAQLWMALRKLNVQPAKIRVDGKPTKCWSVVFNSDGTPDLKVPDFDPEF